MSISALDQYVNSTAAAHSATAMRECPLTCEYCKHGPATHLLVFDLRTRRINSLVCETCGNRSIGAARKIAKAASSVWLFTLAPAVIRRTGQ